MVQTTSDEIWAVIDNYGNVMWTRGGSSTSPKIMCYATESKAKSAIKYFNLAETAKAVCVYRKGA